MYAMLEIIFLYPQYIIMSFQIVLLVTHFTNLTAHNLLTNSTSKKIIQDVLLRCLVIVSDLNVKLARHFQNLVGQRLMAKTVISSTVYLIRVSFGNNIYFIYRC